MQSSARQLLVLIGTLGALFEYVRAVSNVPNCNSVASSILAPVRTNAISLRGGYDNRADVAEGGGPQGRTGYQG